MKIQSKLIKMAMLLGIGTCCIRALSARSPDPQASPLTESKPNSTTPVADRSEQRRVTERNKILAENDADHDGNLNASEIDAMLLKKARKHREVNADLLLKYDLNRDGKLDRSERRAMNATVRDHPPK